jgi:DNA repair photolyase
MSVIYEPTGRAKEYSDLACNLYSNCGHGCKYCFAPACLYKTKEDFFTCPAIPRKDIIKKIAHDCEKMRSDNDSRSVLLCFACDPYQHGSSKITRHALETFSAYGINVHILTKGGHRAEKDFDLLKSNDWSFGTTMVFSDQKDVEKWEPGAASVNQRIGAILKAKKMGIKTWISLEPVIDTTQTKQIIMSLMPYVDHWKIGTWNYDKRAKLIDWKTFKNDVEKLLVGRSYYLKHALLEAAK